MRGSSPAIPWAIVAVLLLANAVLGLRELNDRFQAQFLILEGDRPYAFKGSCLTDAEAVELANHAMRLAGFSELEWQPSPHGRDLTASDGSKDVYFSRNTISPNDGYVDFVNPQMPGRSIYFSIHHKRGLYHFTLSRGK